MNDSLKQIAPSDFLISVRYMSILTYLTLLFQLTGYLFADDSCVAFTEPNYCLQRTYKEDVMAFSRLVPHGPSIS